MVEAGKANPLILEAVSRLQGDSSARVKETLVAEPLSAEAKEDFKAGGIYVGEEEASKIDMESIEKEIEKDGPEKIVKMPLGMKIDEIDIC